MQISLDIEPIKSDGAIRIVWIPGYEIRAEIQNDVVVISANKEGLKSLAVVLMTLAQDEVIPGAHVHLDELNSLEDGSCGLVFDRIVR
jgi:hypothetical protein